MGTYHGTMLNGATFASGMVGQAFMLDGYDDVIGFDEDFNIVFSGDHPFTIAFWVNMNLPPPGDFDFFMRLRHVQQETPFLQPSQFLIGMTNNLVGPIYTIGTGFRSFTGFQFEVDPALFQNRWAHVALAYSGGFKSSQSVYILYVNAVRQSNPCCGSTVGQACNDNRIGSDNYDNVNPCATEGHFFHGLLDEVQVFDHELTSQEVMDLYTSVVGVGEEKISAQVPAAGFPTPNPTNGEFMIELSMPTAGWTHAELVDVSGRLMRVLDWGTWRGQGRHTVAFSTVDGSPEPLRAGVYWLRVRALDVLLSRRVVLKR